MAVAGIILLGIGSIGICGAVVLELKYHDKKWQIMMKIFPWLVGLGGLLLGLGLR